MEAQIQSSYWRVYCTGLVPRCENSNKRCSLGFQAPDWAIEAATSGHLGVFVFLLRQSFYAENYITIPVTMGYWRNTS